MNGGRGFCAGAQVPHGPHRGSTYQYPSSQNACHQGTGTPTQTATTRQHVLSDSKTEPSGFAETRPREEAMLRFSLTHTVTNIRQRHEKLSIEHCMSCFTSGQVQFCYLHGQVLIHILCFYVRSGNQILKSSYFKML